MANRAPIYEPVVMPDGSLFRTNGFTAWRYGTRFVWVKDLPPLPEPKWKHGDVLHFKDGRLAKVSIQMGDGNEADPFYYRLVFLGGTIDWQTEAALIEAVQS